MARPMGGDGEMHMRYLLVGNAPNSADAVVSAAARSDIVVQINKCHYAELLQQMRANYVFVRGRSRVRS